MKELLREMEFTRVGCFQSILDNAGISTIIRNQNLTVSGLAEISVAEFFPALPVVNDPDYDEAAEIIQEILRERQRPTSPDQP